MLASEPDRLSCYNNPKYNWTLPARGGTIIRSANPSFVSFRFAGLVFIISFLAGVGCVPLADGQPDDLNVELQERQAPDCEVEEIQSLERDREGNRMTVDACIMARDGCHRPRLAGFEYNPDLGSLSLAVEEHDVSEPDQACTMALTKRSYRLVIKPAPDLHSLILEENDVHGTRHVTWDFTTAGTPDPPDDLE